MLKDRGRWIVLMSGLCISNIGLQAEPVPAAESGPSCRLTIEVDRPGKKISPMLYGIFFEEINRAGDGGLYAEMVQNRSFEDAVDPVAWRLVTTEDARGAMSVVSDRPLNPRNTHALKIAAAEIAAGRVGAVNDGFNGMRVQAGAAYNLSLYALSPGGSEAGLRVAIENKDGSKVYAAQEIAGLSSEWKRFSVRLTATGTDSTARLAVYLARPGEVLLDMVSLFPVDTFKNRPNGLRRDLAEMLQEMRPAFVRFPGGCFVEGNKLANAFRWKDTIGDIAERPGHWNLWGYRSTDGLGYHEYLQLCEDLGAEPLFVINCGMAHEDVVPIDQIGAWTQDALDAIEYANGPANSQWGAVRAASGHPAPFNLKYMEIGNENGGPAYHERYALFYDAVKARYPRMQLVVNEWQGRPTSRPVELIDEHYYNNSEFFIENADRYNTYDRKGPRVYVGEYAVTLACGRGNLWAAIGEAAFMTGLERNADVVAMASYAPLFVNVGWRQWNPDAINFDSARAYGTPSYHVQKMFSRNRGDVVLPARIEGPQVQLRPLPGMVGVGTWDTQAEFKDIRVESEGRVVFHPDLRDGLKGWKAIVGDWQAQDGVFRQTSGQKPARALAVGDPWTDCVISLKARKISGSEGFLILFRADEQTRTWLNIGGWGNTAHAIEFPDGPYGQRVAGSIETNRWYDIRIEAKAASIRCWLDGELIHDLTRPTTHRAVYAVASRVEADGDLVLKVVNVAAHPVDAQIAWQGLAAGTRKAEITTLTSASPDDENTLEQPTKVVPKTELGSLTVPTCQHRIPARSVTVIRLKPGS